MKTQQGLRRIMAAFGYSMAGLKAAWQNEAAFREETVLAALLIPAALFMPTGPVGKALLIGSVFLVLVVELLNSAIETVVDHISLEQHPLAKRAKDMGSAAVWGSLINVLLVWGTVLLAY
jgi:diacylglycerol kinase (ATP)